MPLLLDKDGKPIYRNNIVENSSHMDRTQIDNFAEVKQDSKGKTTEIVLDKEEKEKKKRKFYQK